MNLCHDQVKVTKLMSSSSTTSSIRRNRPITTATVKKKNNSHVKNDDDDSTRKGSVYLALSSNHHLTELNLTSFSKFVQDPTITLFLEQQVEAVLQDHNMTLQKIHTSNNIRITTKIQCWLDLNTAGRQFLCQQSNNKTNKKGAKRFVISFITCFKSTQTSLWIVT